jgi:hypothetical protein
MDSVVGYGSTLVADASPAIKAWLTARRAKTKRLAAVRVLLEDIVLHRISNELSL